MRTLNFREPDRTPRDLWWLDAVELNKKEELEEVLNEFPLDIVQTKVNPQQTPVQKDSQYQPTFNYGNTELLTRGNYIDEWGCIRYVAEDGVSGEVKDPILSDLSNFDKITPPWEFINSLNISDINRQCKNDKFCISGVCARPFERLQFLRGSENLYKDLYKHRDLVLEMLDIVHKYNLEHIKKWLRTNVNGIFLMDDWGSQENLLISPKLWREIFKPIYREYVELIHGDGKYAFFHSDGWIEDIFGDFVDIGIDAINSQLFVMDIDRLAKKYGDKIAFWGEIDRQNILPFGNPKDVREAVFKVRNAFKGTPGGLIAQCEWGKNVPKENIESLFEAWQTPFEELESSIYK